MPRPPKYPLKPLLEHRDRKVEDATVELGDAVREREQAADACAQAERARREAEERAAGLRATEAAQLEEGALRAVDLARREAWEIGVKAQVTDLSRAVEAAGTALSAARNAEVAARDELARTKADRDVVAKDQARFAERARRAAESSEEEEAAEAWRDKRGGR